MQGKNPKSMSKTDSQLKSNDCGISAIKTVFTIFEKNISRKYIESHVAIEGMDVLPATMRLSDIELSMYSVEDREFLLKNLIDSAFIIIFGLIWNNFKCCLKKLDIRTFTLELSYLIGSEITGVGLIE